MLANQDPTKSIMNHARLALVLLGTVAAGLLLSQEQQLAPVPTPTQPAEKPLSPQQLEDLVAPIALYPDTLLSQLLVASTYPLEVVEAEQWLQLNGKFKGKKLMNEAKHQNWDPSIQALVVFPAVLARLNQDIRWTTDLGNVFLEQQAAVMAAVQRLRTRAQASGKLNSNEQETVSTQTNNGQSAIDIQPVNPETVYVPEYNPAYFWGAPEYGGYPPLMYPSVGVGFSFMPGIDLGLYFGDDWGMWGGYGWGWGPNWFGGGIFMNDNFFHRYGFRNFHPGYGGGNVWRHDPGHRQGVPYPNRALTNQYRGAATRQGGADFREREGQQERGAEGLRAAPGERFGTRGFEQQNSARNHSAFGGMNRGAVTRMQSNRGFSGMHGGGFGGGGFHGGGGHGGGGHGGGGRR